MSRKNEIIFEEVQYMRDFKLIPILLAICFCGVVVGIAVDFSQTWNRGESLNTGDLIGTTFATVMLTAVTVLLFSCRLVTEVRRNGLFIRYYHFHFRFHEIDLKKIESIEARTYSPVWEYGGWGIRCGWKKKAYNVYGSEGVEITYKEGKKLLIGSQKAKELARAIESIRQ